MSDGIESRISQLEAKVQAFKERIANVTSDLNDAEQAATDLAAKADAIAQDVTNVEGRITGLLGQIDTANTQIADLEAQLAAAGTTLDFGPLKATLAGVSDSLTASDTALDAAAPDPAGETTGSPA